MPINYGEIQRIISTDGDITVFFNNKVVNQLYGKSIIADLQGNESLALSNEVLGGYVELEYDYGVSENPESIVANGNLIYFTDKYHSRLLMKGGKEIQELNPPRGGMLKESVAFLKDNHTFIGAFNEAFGDYVISLNHEKSIAFNLIAKGFTHYTTNALEFNYGFGGSYYTAMNGKLYENEVSNMYGHFAGQEFQNPKVKFVVNPEIDSDKIFKALNVQSNVAWNTTIKTNLTESFIAERFFNKKESFFYSDIFKDIKGKNTSVGIGVIQSVQDNTIFFNRNIPIEVSVNDMLQTELSAMEYKIVSINDNAITLANVNSLVIGRFAYAVKQHSATIRPDGSAIRGKWMEVTFEKETNEEAFITSVTTNLIKSYL